jgi:hypothetical protein
MLTGYTINDITGKIRALQIATGFPLYIGGGLS